VDSGIKKQGVVRKQPPVVVAAEKPAGLACLELIFRDELQSGQIAIGAWFLYGQRWRDSTPGVAIRLFINLIATNPVVSGD
jgi:hypothetical protein